MKQKKQKEIKLTDKELIKLVNILGLSRVKYLHIYSKIKLSSEQIDLLINWKED